MVRRSTRVQVGKFRLLLKFGFKRLKLCGLTSIDCSGVPLPLKSRNSIGQVDRILRRYLRNEGPCYWIEQSSDNTRSDVVCGPTVGVLDRSNAASPSSSPPRIVAPPALTGKASFAFRS